MRRLLPFALLSAGCTIHVVTPLPDTGDAGVDVGEDEGTEDAGAPEDQDGAPVDAEDAGADRSDPARDTGTSDTDGAMDTGALDAGPDASGADAGATADAAGTDASGADAALPDAKVCGPNPLRKQAPELRIVLDRSNSMRPVTGLDCRNPDLLMAVTCSAAGIDCSIPAQMARVECGGTQPAYDRWTPVVAALKAYTAEHAAAVDFGLTVFPGGVALEQSCSVGVELVAIAPNNAAPIATALDATQTGGATPTSSTLQAVVAQLEARKAQLGARLPAQHVVLVTDGAPNCVGNSSGPVDVQAHQASVAAIDALARLGVKLWVAGIGDDPALAAQLQEYALHGGTGSWYPVEGASVPAAIVDATRAAGACSYALDHELAGTDVVSLDGRALTRDAPDGFVLRGTSLQLQGAACATLRQAGTHTLSVAWSCEL